MSTPKYLKKKGDPDNSYWAYSEGLMARGDMEPFEPGGVVGPESIEESAEEPAPDQPDTEAPFQVRRAKAGKYSVIGPDGDAVSTVLKKEEAEALAATMNAQG